MKGSALRHSVERLVLDTAFVTFGMQWTGLSSTLHSANDPSIGQQYKDWCLTQALTDMEKRSEHQRRGEETAEDTRVCIWLEDVWSER